MCEAALIFTTGFQVNLGGIIDLLSAHLYSGPAVYLRELLQNGVDALTARASLVGRGDLDWRIEIRTDARTGTLTFCDDGVGLLPDEMERFLSTTSRRWEMPVFRLILAGVCRSVLDPRCRCSANSGGSATSCRRLSKPAWHSPGST
jgi:hypothetical protein